MRIGYALLTVEDRATECRRSCGVPTQCPPFQVDAEVSLKATAGSLFGGLQV